MKMICDPIPGDQPSANRRAATLVFGLMLATGLLVSGCSKSKPAAAQLPPATADTNASVAQMPPQPVYTPAPVEVAANPDGGVDLKALNQAYVGWIVQTRRSPASFEEYVAMSGVKAPPPPPGKKFVIDHNGFINLANK